MKIISQEYFWECSCGSQVPQEAKEHKDCLSFFVNGKTGRIFVQMQVDPELPVEYIRTSFSVDLNET